MGRGKCQILLILSCNMSIYVFQAAEFESGLIFLVGVEERCGEGENVKFCLYHRVICRLAR